MVAPPTLVSAPVRKTSIAHLAERRRLRLLSFQPLFQVPHLKALVAAWLLSEWPDWYGVGGAGHLDSDVKALADSEAQLPVGIVAFDDGVPIGFGALKQESLSTHAHWAPWAAAGYVEPSRRGQGVGAALLRALAEHAKAMGYTGVYCGTSTAASLLRRAGWREIEQIVHAGKPLVIFRGEVSLAK